MGVLVGVLVAVLVGVLVEVLVAVLVAEQPDPIISMSSRNNSSAVPVVVAAQIKSDIFARLIGNDTPFAP